MIKIKTNFTGGILTVLLGVLLMILLPYQIQIEKELNHSMIDAAFVPKLTTILIITFGIFLIVESVLFKKEKTVTINKKDLIRVGCFLCILIAYAKLFNLVGFVISTLLLCCVILKFLNCKDKKMYMICGVFTLCVYFIFTLLLSIPLP